MTKPCIHGVRGRICGDCEAEELQAEVERLRVEIERAAAVVEAARIWERDENRTDETEHNLIMAVQALFSNERRL